MQKYGNTFSGGRESIDVGKIPVWNSVDELYPGGCVITGTAGTTVKAGTAVYVPKMGGTATIYAEDAADVTNGVTGLLLEDVYIGNVGATGTVVTKGSILSARAATISATVKAAVSGRITFIEE
jgi:hypothetical protein